ncbi:MAG: hypothetical protein WKF51_04235 [Geodermatophilaceae bacterium]
MKSFVSVVRPIAILSGPLVIASVAVEFGAVGSPEAAAGPPGIIASVLALAGVFALVVGVIALYAAQSATFGRLGLSGVLLALFGATLTLGGIWSQVFVVPGLHQAAPDVLADGGLTTVLIGFVVSYSLLGLGGLLFGIASLRAAVLPRWTSIVMIVGGVVCFAPLPARYLVLAVAISLAAAQLRSGVRTTQGEPAIA